MKDSPEDEVSAPFPDMIRTTSHDSSSSEIEESLDFLQETGHQTTPYSSTAPIKGLSLNPTRPSSSERSEDSEHRGNNAAPMVDIKHPKDKIIENGSSEWPLHKVSFEADLLYRVVKKCYK